MKPKVDIQRILQLFREIRSEFPNLEMTLDEHPPHVDVSMDVPIQNGLKFKVNLNLQGDELHLCAGDHFWVEWFPCTDERVVADYREAVHGLLSGKSRLVEYYRGKRAVRGELQRPDGNGWKTINGWSNLFNFLPGRRTIRILGTD